MLNSVPVSELPPQTSRDVQRDYDNCAMIERLAAECGVHELGPRYYSDRDIKWILRPADVPRLKYLRVATLSHHDARVYLSIPRSYEKLSFRWVDAVPAMGVVLALISAANLSWTAYEWMKFP